MALRLSVHIWFGRWYAHIVAATKSAGAIGIAAFGRVALFIAARDGFLYQSTFEYQFIADGNYTGIRTITAAWGQQEAPCKHPEKLASSPDNADEPAQLNANRG